MKIATWNVNSIRARQARVLAWLDQHRPDVLCMQETKAVDDQFPVAELDALGYRVAPHGQRTYNGVAIAARGELSDVTRGLGDGGDDEQSRAMAATFGGVRVVSVYVPNGQQVGHDKYRFKLTWLERLGGYLARACAGGAPVVLCGDFNVAPQDRDIHDPARWDGAIMCSEPERAALRGAVACGLVDAFRALHPEPGFFTWWDYRQLAFPEDRGLRIDHIYLAPALADRCVEASIDRSARKGVQPSDHAPVVIQLAE
jgi:exodeoxyribonuclease-3